jgi:large subunit ribosomal protein L24
VFRPPPSPRPRPRPNPIEAVSILTDTMQKILRRVATAERVVARRRAKRDTQIEGRTRRREKQQNSEQLESVRLDIDRARKQFKDDFKLGPIAPNYYVGEHAKTYGAIAQSRYQPGVILRREQLEARCKWLGGSKFMNLAVGDRVVVLEGPDKGKIGKVNALDKEAAVCVVEGLNKVCSATVQALPSR